MPRRKIESRHVQARLSADRPDDYDALAVFHEWEAAGYNQREIVVRALMALGGKEPPVEKGEVSPGVIRSALESMQDFFADVMGAVLDERLDEFSRMAPAERKQSLKDAAGSSLRRSIQQSVDVADYEGGE